MWSTSVSTCDPGHLFSSRSCYDKFVEYSMRLRPFQTKFIAAFLLLFVCMNAGGAVCVAYCRSVVLNATDEHCPLAKKDRHCDKSAPENRNETALTAGQLDCCPMIVSFIPGTFEPKQTFNTATTAVPASNFVVPPLIVASQHRFANIPAYRGPPKKEQELHITNRILRI